MTRWRNKISNAIAAGATLLLLEVMLDQWASWRAIDDVRSALRRAPGWRAERIEAHPWRGTVSLESLSFTTPEGRVSIGRLDLPALGLGAVPALLPAAFANIGIVHAHDIDIRGSAVVVSIPDIEVEGAVLGSREIEALFGTGSKEPIEARLAKLSFARAAARVVEVRPVVKAGSTGENRTALVVQDVVLSKGVAGQIGKIEIRRIASLDKPVTSRGGTLRSTKPAASATVPAGAGATSDFETGKLEFDDIDLPLAWRIAAGARADAAAPNRRVWSGFLLSGIRIASEDQGRMTIGAIESAALRARPPLLPIAQIVAIGQKKPEDRSDDEKARLAAAFPDLYASYVLDHVEMRDFVSPAGQQPKTMMRLGSFIFDGCAGLKCRGIDLAGLAVQSQDTEVALRQIRLEGLDQSGSLAALQAMSTGQRTPVEPEEVFRVTPKIDAVALHDLHIKTATPDGSGNAPDGLSALIDVPAIEARVVRSIDGAASDVSTHAQLIYDIAPSTPAAGLQSAIKAGFGRFDITSDGIVHWDAETGAVRFDHLSLVLKDQASLDIGGKVAGFSLDLANGDAGKRDEALAKLKLEALGVTMIDAGMTEKILTAMAASAHVSPALFKAELLGQTQVAIVKALGPGPTTDQLTNAITSFLNQPKNIAVSVQSPDGIAVKTLKEAKSIKDLPATWTLTAEANR